MKAFITAAFTHIAQWLEIYFWIPVALVCIPLAAYFARYLQHGHPVQEDMSWIVDDSSRLVPCILLIALVSLTREANGVWLTKEELLSHPKNAAIQAFKTCFFAAIFVYLWSH